jgi:C4-dicarboxylate-specific signal transduction histidine kinase
MDDEQVDPAVLAAVDARCHEMWLLAASTVVRARDGMRSKDPAERARVAREAAGTLAALALALEGDRPGELAELAELLAREADEAERLVEQRTRKLRLAALFGFAPALLAPRRKRSDVEHLACIANFVTNLTVAHRIREREDRERSWPPRGRERLMRGRGR